MEEESIPFIKQLLSQLENERLNLAEAKKEKNLPEFNSIKKRCLELYSEIEKLI